MKGYEYLPKATGNIMNKCHLYLNASMKFLEKLAYRRYVDHHPSFETTCI
jgi:hypothetical protein